MSIVLFSRPISRCIGIIRPRKCTTPILGNSQMYNYSQSTPTSNIEAPLGRNPGLESVISQGVQSLEKTAADVQAKTRNVSLALHATGKNAAAQQGPNPRQLAESQRIWDVATEALEDLCERQQGNMYLGGEPIVILDVRVNSNAKLAKVYWTLPFGVLTDTRMTVNIYNKLMSKMQEHVQDNGGAKLLARQVSNRLRSYYPPRLRLTPATADMVAEFMAESMGDDI